MKIIIKTVEFERIEITTTSGPRDFIQGTTATIFFSAHKNDVEVDGSVSAQIDNEALLKLRDMIESKVTGLFKEA